MNSGKFDFLGYTFQKYYNRKLKRKLPYQVPNKKALNSVKNSIREITCRKSKYELLDSKVKRLNPIIRGWRNDFTHGNSAKSFIQLDEYLWMKMWRLKYSQRKQRKYREAVLMEYKEWLSGKGVGKLTFRLLVLQFLISSNHS